MTESATRLVLVRHGQTDSNAGGRFQGHQDVPLNRIGRKQAAAMAVQVARMNPARIVSSDLGRAVTTALALAERTGLPVVTDPQLREINVGTWQGRTVTEIAAENPWFTEALAERRDFRRSASGETATEAGERIAAVLDDLVRAHPGETSVVVGHGLALVVGMTLWLGLDSAASFAFGGLWNGSWTTLNADGHRRIVSYNTVGSSPA